jgi:hypothetical protein
VLPHEAEAYSAIAKKYPNELSAMSALHESVVGMMTAGSWTIGKPGLDGIVVQTMMGLLTKACKTFRSIEILCERGLYDDATAEVRVLMETTVAVLFILQRRSKERVRIYHAYAAAQDVKMIEKWRITPGLKRKATKRAIQLAAKVFNRWFSQIPAHTNIKKHWSGLRSLEEATEAIRWGVVYQTLYRHASPTSHAADFSRHVDASGDEIVWEIEPQVDGLAGPAVMAREMLWHLASRIDQRLGLGFGASLAPHRVGKEWLPPK